VLNREPGQSGFEIACRVKRSGDEIRDVRAGAVAKAIAFTKNEGRGGAHMLFWRGDRDMVINGNFCLWGVG